jgi:LynF/TruF/PatF family peptide O-prenyltransferase
LKPNQRLFAFRFLIYEGQTMQSNNAEIEKYHSHLTSFNAESTLLCVSFLDLLKDSPEAHLECSCKIIGETVYPLRLNLWYRNNGEVGLNPKIDAFLKNYAQISPLNLSLYQQIVGQDFQYDKVKCTCVGIDVRPQSRASRVKLWHIIEHYPEKEAMILNFPEISPIAQSLKIQPDLLFGFDFELDGGTAVKVYPALHISQIHQSRSLLNILFGKRTLALLEQCEWVNFGFTTKEAGLSLHLLPRNPQMFIDYFHYPVLSHAYRLSGAQKVIISLDQAEAESSCYSSFNLYY